MIKELEQTPSTNTWAKEHADTLRHGDIVVTHCQSAGRGQRGNSWEAEPGKNLTFSLFLEPHLISPANQFLISEIVAIAVVNAVRRALAEAVDSHRVKVKWPNDIYVDNHKIAGILIEHSLQSGKIAYTIAGIGLNVNQTAFVSDAPNPISLAQLARREFHLPPILIDICSEITSKLQAPDAIVIHNNYLADLWRKDGLPHMFSLPDGTEFNAVISHIAPDGVLHLKNPDGTPAGNFYFKEVAFVL